MGSEYWNGKVEFDHDEAQTKMSAYRRDQIDRQQKREEEAKELAAALEQELALEEARVKERTAVRDLPLPAARVRVRVGGEGMSVRG